MRNTQVWAAVCLGIITTAFVVFALFVHAPAQGPFYSLIVTDASNHDWAVDYNLTLTDCESMRTSDAARCTLQPEGKI